MGTYCYFIALMLFNLHTNTARRGTFIIHVSSKLRTVRIREAKELAQGHTVWEPYVRIHHEDKRFSGGRALGKESEVSSNAQPYHELAVCFL